MRRFVLMLALATTAFTSPVFAEDEADQNAVNVANMQVQLNQMREEIRGLRGQLEQSQYQARVNADTIKRLQADNEYRFQSVEQKQAALTAPPAPVAPPVAPAPAATAPHTASNFSPDAGTQGIDDPAPDGIPPAVYQKDGKNTTTAPTGKDFPDANAHYTYAFKLLNDKKYAEASASFDAFVKKYPADPLTGNAYYWLGESYYARNDFTRASDSFRKGYEAAPQGQKAADNLYKLAMSLTQVKRVPEACIILAQVASKYADSNARTAARATTERTNLQCK